MSQVGVEHSALRVGSRDWTALSEAMTTASGELADATTAGLAPSVVGAASSFLTSWSGHAEESAQIADGFAGALTAASEGYGRSDESAQTDFSDLDGRLGPAT